MCAGSYIEVAWSLRSLSIYASAVPDQLRKKTESRELSTKPPKVPPKYYLGRGYRKYCAASTPTATCHIRRCATAHHLDQVFGPSPLSLSEAVQPSTLAPKMPSFHTAATMNYRRPAPCVAANPHSSYGQAISPWKQHLIPTIGSQCGHAKLPYPPPPTNKHQHTVTER